MNMPDPFFLRLFFVLPLCLAGCSLPASLPLDAPQPKHWLAQDEIPPPPVASSPPVKQWWHAFHSPLLDTLMNESLQHNRDLQTSRASLAEARQVWQASADSRWPQADLLADAGRQKYGQALFGPANFVIPPFTYIEAGPAISWTADLSGRQRATVARSLALAKNQRYRLEATWLMISQQIAMLSFDLAEAEDEQLLRRQIIDIDQQLQDLMKQSRLAGAATRPEETSSMARLDADRTALPELEQRISSDRHALASLLGITPDQQNLPVISLHGFTLPEPPLSLPSALAHQRPDILAAESSLHAAEATYGFATASHYPDITLSAQWLQEALTPAGLFHAANAAWAMGAGVDLPIANGGKLDAQTEAARQGMLAARSQYQQTVLEAFRQVADQLTALSHDHQLQTDRHQATQTSREQLDMDQFRRQTGDAGVLPELADRRDLLTRQIAELQVRQARLRDSAGLLVSLGGSGIPEQ